jgi:hypothetical protein
MALSAGAVVAQFDGDFKGLNKGLKQAEGNITGFVKGIDKASKNVTKSISAMGKGMESLGKNISLFVTTPLTVAFGLLSKQAIDQVKQVQNASFGLKAYEKDADKVANTLKGLVGYAQSDMGVLFQRQDLFQAASTLRIYGNETDTIVDKVKTLSKGVSLGTTTFAELSQMIGETTQASFLTTETFDSLARRGIKLDSVFRNSAISTERLFEELEKVLPDELLEGRANTIEGQMIRLQSAFRNVGATIIGVNKDANGFMPNSIGERIFQTGEQIRQFVRSAEFLEMVRHAGERLTMAFDFLAQQIQKLYNWFIALSPEQRKLATDILLVVAALGPVLIAFGAFIGMISFAVAPLFGLIKIIGVFALAILGLNPIVLAIIGVITALAGVAFLVIRNWNQVSERFRNLWSEISNNVNGIGDSIKNGFKGAVDYVNNLINKWNPLNKVSGLVSGIGNILKGKIPGFADGVRNFSGGLAVVGERGPELVNLPAGSDVFSNQESRAMSGGITIENMNIKSGIDWELGAQYMAQKLRLS